MKVLMYHYTYWLDIDRGLFLDVETPNLEYSLGEHLGDVAIRYPEWAEWLPEL